MTSSGRAVSIVLTLFVASCSGFASEAASLKGGFSSDRRTEYVGSVLQVLRGCFQSSEWCPVRIEGPAVDYEHVSDDGYAKKMEGCVSTGIREGEVVRVDSTYIFENGRQGIEVLIDRTEGCQYLVISMDEFDDVSSLEVVYLGFLPL